MNPRLEQHQYDITPEDYRIWMRLIWRYHACWYALCQEQDRRDSQLMYTVQRVRVMLRERRSVQLPDPHPFGWIWAGGELP